MNLPVFVYSLDFWKAVAYVIAALLAYFTDYKLESAVLLAAILAGLNLVNVRPELKEKGLL